MVLFPQNVLIVEVGAHFCVSFAVKVGSSLYSNASDQMFQDIIDTGKTMQTLLELLKQYNPKMVKVAR